MGLRSKISSYVYSAPADAEAIAYEDTWWTWGDIRDVANRFTPLLDAAGLGEGARVGVVLRNRPKFVAIVAAALASGRTVVTLSALQPKERLIADIAAAGVPVVLGDREQLDDLDVRGAIEQHGFGLVISDDGEISGEPAMREWPDSAFSTGITMEILTSGTTGPPKRVKLSDAQFDAGLDSAPDPTSPKLRSGVTIVNAPLVHIGGLWAATNSLCLGRRLVLLDRFRVDTWVDAVARYKPRLASVVPAALRALLDADVAPEALASLEAVSSGTAPCPPELADAFYERFGVPVLTTYGATEFAGVAAFWTLEDWKRWHEQKRGSVGRATPGVEIEAFDPESGEPVAHGVAGGLRLRGRQISPSRDWVVTSDLGLVDEDGFVFLTGRADDAIIRGGFKVHKASIQKALEAHPLVRTAAVVSKPDPRLGEVPVAAVELEPGASLTIEQLDAHARSLLVPYEVPAALLIVDALPRTSALKVAAVDVQALFENHQVSAVK